MVFGVVVLPLALLGQSVTLAWNPSADPNVTGYIVSCGTDGVNFTNQVDVGTNNPATITNVTPGATNYFNVLAYDVYSDQSQPSAAVSYYVLPHTSDLGGNGGSFAVGTTIVTNANTGFALLVSGRGTLTPSRRSYLEGKKYTVTATPAKGWVFANWTSNEVVLSVTSKLTFLVGSNEMFQANFVTNPFIPVVGTYHGLFYVTSNAAEESSGSFTATVSSAGTYSAKLLMPGQSHSWSGQFSTWGSASKTLARPGLSALAVQIQLGLTNDSLTGTVADGDWTADLLAYSATYSRTNPNLQAGKYTLSFPASTNTSDQPGGNGFGTLTVSALGNIAFSGVLGDGTPVQSAALVSRGGLWPFYSSLYGGKGSVLGWLTFTNNDAMTGQVGWFKLPQTAAKLYAGGFTNSSEAIGSAYHYTNGVPVLNFTNGMLTLSSGNLGQGITNQIVTGPENEATNASGDKLTFTASSGVFRGSVMNPETGKPIIVNGVVLENQNVGVGLFLGTNESGSVTVLPEQ